MEARFDGTARDIKNFGDLFVRMSLKFTKDNDLAVFLGKRCKHLLNVEGGVIVGAGVWKGIWERIRLADAAGTEKCRNLIGKDSREPSRQRRATFKPLGRLEGTQERLLDHVLGIGAIFRTAPK